MTDIAKMGKPAKKAPQKPWRITSARERRKMWRTTRLAWMLLLPSFVFLAMFTFYPIGYSVWM